MIKSLPAILALLLALSPTPLLHAQENTEQQIEPVGQEPPLEAAPPSRPAHKKKRKSAKSSKHAHKKSGKKKKHRAKH